MAIEQYTLATTNDLKNLVESLGWFDNVAINISSSGEVLGQLDSYPDVNIVKFAGPTGGMSANSTAFNTGTRTITMGCSASTDLRLIYAFKTKNGLLLTDDSVNCYSQVLLGKTNNGDIACCMSTHASEASTYDFWAAAVGETDQYIGTSNRTIRIGVRNSAASTASRFRWTGTPQITACQIPTCPSSGTSYIKGALMLVTTNMNSLGTVEINGVQYATTGDLCLSDDD